MKISKAKALEILGELVSRIESLEQQAHVNSPEFIQWYCDTDTAIQNLFPDKKGRLARFKSIEFKMGFDTRLPQTAYKIFFCTALLKAKAVLQSMISEIETYWNENGDVTVNSTQAATTTGSKCVFVVHGRNQAMRDSLFNFLRAIGLKPLEWAQAVKETGEGSPYVGQVLDKAFDLAQAVVVLMTPDDEAYLRKEFHTDYDEQHEKQPTPQARPNVLFEAGMAMGRNSHRTVLVQIGQLRPFSDIGGRHVLRLNNSSQSRQDLAQRLKTAGCDVDLTGTDWHTVGSFELCGRGKGNIMHPLNDLETGAEWVRWKNNFLPIIAALKIEMMRLHPSEWYSTFETSIVEVGKLIVIMPNAIGSNRKEGILSIVDRLKKMTDSEVVYGKGEVFVMLEKLEALVNDTPYSSSQPILEPR